MEKITYNNIIRKIVEEFPEYRNSLKYWDNLNDDIQYIVLGNLALMAFENLDERPDTALAEKLVIFTNQILNNPENEDKLKELFQVSVLEQLVGSRTGAILAKKYLNGRSVYLLEFILKDSLAKEFEEEYRKK